MREYGTDKGELRSGASQVLSTLLLDAQHDMVEPFPTEKTIQTNEFSIKQIDSNGAKLSCLSLTPQAYPGYTYCVDGGQSILRISSCAAESIQILHNRILRFQGHFIAGDLKVVHSGKVALTAHLESIERLDTVNEADFTPSADAVVQPRLVLIAGSIAGGLVLKKVAPDYPVTAKDMHVGGVVVLKAIISTEGQIRDLHVVSGPKLFQQSALDAVRQWEYRPYLLNGGSCGSDDDDQCRVRTKGKKRLGRKRQLSVKLLSRGNPLLMVGLVFDDSHSRFLIGNATAVGGRTIPSSVTRTRRFEEAV